MLKFDAINTTELQFAMKLVLFNFNSILFEKTVEIFSSSTSSLNQ